MFDTRCGFLTWFMTPPPACLEGAACVRISNFEFRMSDSRFFWTLF